MGVQQCERHGCAKGWVCKHSLKGVAVQRHGYANMVHAKVCVQRHGCASTGHANTWGCKGVGVQMRGCAKARLCKHGVWRGLGVSTRARVCVHMRVCVCLGVRPDACVCTCTHTREHRCAHSMGACKRGGANTGLHRGAGVDARVCVCTRAWVSACAAHTCAQVCTQTRVCWCVCVCRRPRAGVHRCPCMRGHTDVHRCARRHAWVRTREPAVGLGPPHPHAVPAAKNIPNGCLEPSPRQREDGERGWGGRRPLSTPHPLYPTPAPLGGAQRPLNSPVNHSWGRGAANPPAPGPGLGGRAAAEGPRQPGGGHS